MKMCLQQTAIKLALNREQRLSAGFTLLELSVVLAIVSILVLIAAPSFSSLISSRQVKSTASALFVSMTRARSEAITRRENITLAAKVGGWQNGWQILDPNNVVLDDRGASKTVEIIPGAPISVIYRSSGRINGKVSPSFVVTSTVSANLSQCISVDLTGRPYMKVGQSC